MTMQMWMVRSGEEARLFEDFKKNDLVSIGWNEIGDLSKTKNHTDVRYMVEQAYRDKKDGWKIISTSQLSRFVFDFKEGDYVLTYNPKEREYLVGKINGLYKYEPERTEHRHLRKVHWEGTIPRDTLSVATRNTLGAISTLFKVGEEAAEEILKLLSEPKKSEVTQAKEQLEEIKGETIQNAHEFIKDKVLVLDGYEVQELVAGILQAMGYKTRVSPLGSDRGRDIEASPDGLGLNDPHIVVEVKHRQGAIGSQQLRSFIGALRSGHKGLYVSTGGFTKDAKYEAERANNPVTLIDLDDLVNLIVQYYDNFDAEARSLIPLRKIYWPE